MKTFVLSTMYAQQDRFNDGAVFARFAVEAGYSGIEISHSTDALKIEAIRAAGVLPIVSLHQPAPYERHSDGRPNADLNLASPDEAERAAAVAYAERTIALAGDLGARAVVVHLGHIDAAGLSTATHDVYRAYHEGWEPERAEAARHTARTLRAGAAEAHLAAARGSLCQLVRLAADRGVAIGLENRLNFHEIPHAGELPLLLDGFDPGEAGYWHDVGHAEVLARLGYFDRATWFRDDVATIGAHVHDVEGVVDHRAPGDGDVRWGYLAAKLAHLDSLTLEINQHQPDASVLAALPFLRGQGLG